MEYTTTTLDGVTYYEAQDARGNVTTVFEMCGTVFVQTNRTPAKALEDVKNLSKTAAALVDIFNADKEAVEEAAEETNERYEAFKSVVGVAPMWVYMDFIAAMEIMYFGSSSVHNRIHDHDEFTLFVQKNAHKYEVPA